MLTNYGRVIVHNAETVLNIDNQIDYDELIQFSPYGRGTAKWTLVDITDHYRRNWIDHIMKDSGKVNKGRTTEWTAVAGMFIRYVDFATSGGSQEQRIWVYGYKKGTYTSDGRSSYTEIVTTIDGGGAGDRRGVEP